MEESHLSPRALERLKEELEKRTGPDRKRISAWIERAREHGDIRENADYDAAKNEQGHNEARIRHIQQMLKNAVVVEAGEADVVSPGSLVEIRIGDVDDTTTYLVGSIEERHDTYDVVSPSSPLGKALIGRGPGEVVTYEGPRKPLEVELVSVKPLD
ncbi:MAG: transcription elongation factor GreA [Acidimicrobiia bacterium]|nr:transcription elongation factor GreA [Acidimicrobiia bacterium]